MSIYPDVFKRKYVKKGKILPNDVTEIAGDLYLADLGISKIENLPNKIDGHLILERNKIKKIENIPKNIKGSIVLSDNPIKDFNPIHGYFYLIFYKNKTQTMQEYNKDVRKYSKKKNIKKLEKLFQ